MASYETSQSLADVCVRNHSPAYNVIVLDRPMFEIIFPTGVTVTPVITNSLKSISFVNSKLYLKLNKLKVKL